MPLQATRDIWSFFRAWGANPGRVGAVLPSGNVLAELITRDLSRDSGPVIELGPGTGVFTRALLARGIREEDLVLVDASAAFAQMVQARFPRARVLCIDATELGSNTRLDGVSAGAVISGLPLLNMTTAQVSNILQGAFTRMRADGALYQFTYGLRCPVATELLEHLGLRAVRVGRTWLNVPPASVYKISTRAAQ